MVSVADVSKVMSRVEFGNGCWIWHGQMKENGYGLFKRNYAHRLVFYFYKGYMPEKGIVLDHLCRNRRCVKPSHLEPVTIGENVLRGSRYQGMKRGYCLSGKHELTEENTYKNKSGRACKLCVRIRRSHDES